MTRAFGARGPSGASSTAPALVQDPGLSPTRVVVQLQEGHDHLDSVKGSRVGMSSLHLAMMVRALHANTCDLFARSDQDAYERAVERLCATLHRAMTSRFGRTGTNMGGNRLRETFQASRVGKRATCRLDMGGAGQLSLT